MTEQLHPITPPPKLVGEWSTEAGKLNLRTPSNLVHVANRAAQWGADTELEACCELLKQKGVPAWSLLRAARRPKPPSLKRVALLRLDTLNADLGLEDKGMDLSQIRRALEALPDD